MIQKSNRQHRQRIRMGVILFTFLLFPIVMNFLSPYVIIDGAFNGSLPAVYSCFVRCSSVHYS